MTKCPHCGQEIQDEAKVCPPQAGWGPSWLGVSLILLGLVFLLDLDWHRFWPIILVAMGLAMLFGSRRRFSGG